jgi:hypothetical protein
MFFFFVQLVPRALQRLVRSIVADATAHPTSDLQPIRLPSDRTAALRRRQTLKVRP